MKCELITFIQQCKKSQKILFLTVNSIHKIFLQNFDSKSRFFSKKVLTKEKICINFYLTSIFFFSLLPSALVNLCIGCSFIAATFFFFFPSATLFLFFLFTLPLPFIQKRGDRLVLITTVERKGKERRKKIGARLEKE